MSPDPPGAQPPGDEPGRAGASGEGEEADSARAPARATPARAVVPRWVQLVLLPLAVLAAWALARAAGKVLIIFIIAALIALVLNPLVSFVKRSGLRRGLSVLVVYLAFFIALAGVGFGLANPVSNQVQSFSHNLPHLINEANHQIVSFEGFLHKAGIHAKLRKQGETALQTLRDKVLKSSSSIASFGGGLLTEAVGAGIDILLIFVLSVYMLLYGERIGELVRKIMPSGDGSSADDYPTLTQHAVSRYVGGQLFFSTIMGTTAGLALYIYGVTGIFPDGSKYAFAFGVFVGVMELVPYIGPILGALPPILVALFTEPVVALWVALLFLGIQQLEGHVVAPQIFGHTLRINPLLVIVALLLGQQLYGLLGIFVALPVLAILRETVLYLHRHLVFESWEHPTRRLL